MHGHDITERIEVFEREDGERGVRSKRPIHTNEFICEYEGNLLTESEAKQLEKKYMEEDDPIYMLQVRKKNTTEYQNTCINNGICSTCKIKLLLQAQYQQKVVVFDAFPRVDSVGRYINHSTKPNINLMKPIEVRGRLRIGFVAKRHIEKGEELFWNYGFDRRNGEFPPWYRDPPPNPSITSPRLLLQLLMASRISGLWLLLQPLMAAPTPSISSQCLLIHHFFSLHHQSSSSSSLNYQRSLMVVTISLLQPKQHHHAHGEEERSPVWCRDAARGLKKSGTTYIRQKPTTT